MKSLLIDSSSAILLYKAELFHLVAGGYKMIMAQSVFKEVTKRGYPGENAFNSLLKKDLLFVEKPKTNELLEQTRSKNNQMGKGESDTINLYPYFSDSFLIMDDGRGAKWCKQTNIPFINALLVPKVLWLSDLLTKESCMTKMISLCELGRYSNKIKNYAFSCSPEDLEFFVAEKFTGET
ncbi:MAG: hypothetical protein GY729_08415 [Desulfobacteraceae bacterium]|nr:hypothetical protein [Desulfobacteraceae bacterium]